MSFGQLFPSVPDFNGAIEKVVSKHYGREVYLWNRSTRIYLPRSFSGWKTVYYCDTKTRLERKIELFKGKMKADYVYQYDSTKLAARKREIIDNGVNSHKGDNIEDEYILDGKGKIVRVNVSSFMASSSLKRMIAAEKDIRYDTQNNIICYCRYGYDVDGMERKTELYEIRYDSFARVLTVDEKAIGEKTIMEASDNNMQSFKRVPISEPELLRKWIYNYNSRGQLVSYTIKYYGEMYTTFGRGDDYKLYFEYDNKDNWIKMYRQVGDFKKRLESKRKIRYR